MRVFRFGKVPGLRWASTYSKIVVTKHGGPEVLEFRTDGDLDALTGTVADDEVVVENKFAGVNFIDTYFRSGLYPNTPPFTVGQEGAGTVVTAGAKTGSFMGKNVAYWGNRTGSYASHVKVNINEMALLDSDADLKSAAAIMLQGLTSHYLVHDTYKVKKGDWVLVHAAAGGCGLLISQMCKNIGANVIGTCGTPEKVELAKTVGRCDHVINYSEKDFPEEVRKIVPEGVHVVYDGVGKSTFEGSLKSLRKRGMMASFGNASGAVDPVAPLALTKAGSLFLTRPTLYDYVADPAERQARVDDVMKWLKTGDIVSTVSMTFPLSKAREAHEALESRGTTGKVVLAI
eukprot:TRINITY_DN6908_c0_g2_i2.p1 TRINITY_DN6908_c0_g2~~TRINITY_DN6908_c0_g2_i2.p1  ORF type:complete len:345 (+),score=109.05 TRINITY_DN6908_c0_g2_i2:852-1886(+)